jgi:hypothetical protein
VSLALEGELARGRPGTHEVLGRHGLKTISYHLILDFGF